LLVACACAAGPVMAEAQPAASRSLVIVGADLADGTGAPVRKANVRIRGERIEAIGDFAPAAGEETLGPGRLRLAPGFIDPHSHSDEGLAKPPLAETQISQGITTLLIGQDGDSEWPLGKFLDERRKDPPALNVASCVGHATVREAVMGKDFKREAT